LRSERGGSRSSQETERERARVGPSRVSKLGTLRRVIGDRTRGVRGELVAQIERGEIEKAPALRRAPSR